MHPIKKYFRALRFVSTAVFFISFYASNGQNLHISAGMEKTVKRCLYGGAMTYETKKKVGVGFFYQTGIINQSQENLKLSDAFYGAVFQIPLARTEKIDFFATARIGMVNEDFLVFVPGLETRIKTWRKLCTVFGMGYRVGYPSIGVKLSHPLF